MLKKVKLQIKERLLLNEEGVKDITNILDRSEKKRSVSKNIAVRPGTGKASGTGRDCTYRQPV